MRPLLTAILFLVSSSFVTANDRDILKKAGLPTDDAGLIAYFEKRTLSATEAVALRPFLTRPNPNAEQLEEMARQFKTLGPRSRPLLDSVIAQLRDVNARKRLQSLQDEWTRSAPPSEAMAAAIRSVMSSMSSARLTTLWNFAVRSADEVEQEQILALIADSDRKHAPPRFLLTALEDEWPGAARLAAYAVARYFEPAYRANAISASSLNASRGLLGSAYVDDLRESQTAARETLVRLANANPDDLIRETMKDGPPPVEVEFLRKQTLSKEEIAKIEHWIEDLGSPDFLKRDRASARLVEMGPSAVPLLLEAEQSDDAEMSRRAYLCIEEIRRKPVPEIALAAIRSLAWTPKRFADADTVITLLDYVPFTDRREVEEALLPAIAFAAIRAGGAIRPLKTSLNDESHARRAAAAWVIGKIGSSTFVPLLKPLLADEHPLVRLRAAQALIFLEQRDGVAPLIRAIAEVPPVYLREIEETLLVLANDSAPKISLADSAPGHREKAKKAWSAWLAKSEAKLDLTSLRRDVGFQGHVIICENDGSIKRDNSKVWLRDRDGRTRWSIDGLNMPVAIHALPNGRVLVAEQRGRRVVEVDSSGKEHWEYQPVTSLIAVQRLANGNTFIATYTSFMEIAPDKTVVSNHQRAGAGIIHYSAQRTADGRVVCTTSRGSIVVYDAATGKQLRTIENLQMPGQNSVFVLPRDRFLIASPSLNGGQVREIDSEGKTLRTVNFPGAFRVIGLPNGNIVVGSLTTRKVAEIDRAGVTRWEVTCQGRPWGLQSR